MYCTSNQKRQKTLPSYKSDTKITLIATLCYHEIFPCLYSSVFDFLTPATPRSAKLFGGLTSRDLGDKSPRLSPRITLPEAPTDLSCGARGQPQEVDEAAEDLSMASKANKVTPPPPLQCLEPPVKQEYSRPSSVVKQEYQSRYVCKRQKSASEVAMC